MKRITTYSILLSTLILSGCSQSVLDISGEATGYSDQSLSGRELLGVAKEYAVISVYEISELSQRVRESNIPESQKSLLLSKLDALDSRRADAHLLAEKYYNPTYTTEKEQRQVFRATTDALSQINTEYIDLVNQLKAFTKTAQAEG